MDYLCTVLRSGEYKFVNTSEEEGLSPTIKEALSAIAHKKEEEPSLAGAGSAGTKKVHFSEDRTMVTYRTNTERYIVHSEEADEPLASMLKTVAGSIDLPETVHCSHTIKKDLPEDATLFSAETQSLDSAKKGIKRTGKNDELSHMIYKNYEELKGLSLLLEDGSTIIIKEVDKLPTAVTILMQNFEVDFETLERLIKMDPAPNPDATQTFKETLTHILELQAAIENRVKASPELRKELVPFLKEYRKKNRIKSLERYGTFSAKSLQRYRLRFI
jgi:hypothetical protein